MQRRRQVAATPVPRRAAGRLIRSAEGDREDMRAKSTSPERGSSAASKRRGATRESSALSSSPRLPPTYRGAAPSAAKPLSDSIIIRPMHFRDCAACFHLGEKVFTSQFPNLYRLWDEYEVIGAFTGASDKCFVAETGDDQRVLVGFVFGDVIKKRRTTNYGYIHWIAVDPVYQRRGIGSMLYHRVLPVMTETDSARLILCDTPADNHSARLFFSRMAFGKPIEHVYMSRNLREAPHPEPTPVSSRSHRSGTALTSNGSSSSHAVVSHSSSASLHSSSVEVREMTIDDIYPVYLMGERVFGNQTTSPNLFRFWEASEVLDLFETDSEFCLVAEDDDMGLVGFCLGTTIKKKRSSWKYGYLIWLGVSPDAQGKGVGAKLAREFQERAVQDGASMIFIDTQADSDAVKFWKKMGFGHAQDHVFLSKTVTDVEREAMQERMSAHHTLISLPAPTVSSSGGKATTPSPAPTLPAGSLEKTLMSPVYRRRHHELMSAPTEKEKEEEEEDHVITKKARTSSPLSVVTQAKKAAAAVKSPKKSPKRKR